MPMNTQDSPSSKTPKNGGLSRPDIGTSSIQYVGAKDPRIPVPILIVGVVVIASAILAYLHFAQP